MTSFTNSVPPTITGNRVVGGTLNASAGTWSPTPGSFNYQWERADDNTGLNLQTITGATGATYTLGSGDVTKVLRVGVYPQPPTTSFVASLGNGLCNLTNWNGISDKTIWAAAWTGSSDPSRASLCANTGVPLRGLYKNAVGARTDTATSESQAEVAAWEAGHGGTGGFLRDGSGIVKYQTTQDLVDPSNDAITDLTIANWQSATTYGIDSFPGLTLIFVDNVGLDVSGFSDTDANGVYTIPGYTGASPSLTPATTANAWARFSQQKYARICAHFQQNGVFLIGNAFASQYDQTTVDNSMYNPTFAWWDTVLRYPTNNTLGPGGAAWRPGEPIFDGYLAEYWIVHSDGHCKLRSDQGTNNFRDYWGERMDVMIIPQGFLTSLNPTPRAFFGLTTATGNTAIDATAARFGRASFLTRWSKLDYSAHTYNGYSNPTALANQPDGDIGNPVGAPYEMSTAGVILKTHTGRFTGPGLTAGRPTPNFASTSSLIVRDFTNGYVIVNATAAARTFTSGRFNGTSIPSGDAVIHVG